MYTRTLPNVSRTKPNESAADSISGCRGDDRGAAAVAVCRAQGQLVRASLRPFVHGVASVLTRVAADKVACLL